MASFFIVFGFVKYKEYFLGIDVRIELNRKEINYI